MPRNLNPRFQQHIARARRTRIIGGALLVTCLHVGTGAALSQTELPHQVATTLKPLAELGNSLSQLPSALSQRIFDNEQQLPTTQLAASATSFPQSIAEQVRNLFCRWLECESDTLLAQQPPQPAIQQRAILPQNVKQPASASNPSTLGDGARSATTTSVVVSSASASASNPKPQQQTVINQPVIEPMPAGRQGVVETTRTAAGVFCAIT